MLFYPTYFSPIAQYVAISKCKVILFEVEDNFQKQTYRNRCYIYGAHGKQLLNVPVKKANTKQQTKDVLIDYTESWHQQHLKAMDAAYRSSPFYEFYYDDIKKVLSFNDKFLLDLNLRCHEFLIDALNLESNYKKTNGYINDYDKNHDLRCLANSKTSWNFTFDEYFQVFSSTNGFIENLSVLDLLFMEGPSAGIYLEKQKLDL